LKSSKSSLDVLSQGGGLGLSLCENLTHLDETYDSGVQDSPGARFMIRLNTPAVSSEDKLQSSKVGTGSNSGKAMHQNHGNDNVCTKVVELPENLSVLFFDDDQ
jgi:hypothetical protein